MGSNPDFPPLLYLGEGGGGKKGPFHDANMSNSSRTALFFPLMNTTKKRL